MDRRTMTPRANADTITGLLTLAVGVAAVALVPSQVSRDGLASFGDVRSPAFFPVLAAGATVALSACLTIRGVLRTVPARTIANPGRVAAVTAALVAATGLIFWLGYLATSALLIAALSWAFGNRRIWMILALAIAVPLGVVALFEGLLDVLLPRGPF